MSTREPNYTTKKDDGRRIVPLPKPTTKTAPEGYVARDDGQLLLEEDAKTINNRAALIEAKTTPQSIEKVIRKFVIDTSELSPDGGLRKFTIEGDNDAVFSMEVYDDDGNYYNFFTKSWSSTVSRIKKGVLKSGFYTNYILFTNVASKTHTYNIMLFAESSGNIRTRHREYNEVRNSDNSLNLNASTGSNSLLLKKTITQPQAITLTMSAIAPSKGDSTTDTKDGAISSGTALVMDTSYLTKKIYLGDKVSGTNIASGTTISAVNVGSVADTYTLSTAVSGSVSDGATITFTSPFDSMTPRYGTTTGAQVLTTSTAGSSNKKFNFSITLTAASGRAFSIIRQPKETDLLAVNTMTMGAAALAIDGENTSSDALFYRWPVDNIAGINKNMILDPSKTAGNTTLNSFVKDYEATTTVTTEGIDAGEIDESEYEGMSEEEISEIISGLVQTTTSRTSVFVDAITPTGAATIDRFGTTTAQAGNLVFNNQQVDALKSDSSIKILGYGPANIKSLTYGADLEFSDLKVELTSITTATSSAVSSSTNIPLAERAGIMDGQSIMTGIGISSENIKVVSGASGNTGAGTIVVSAAQTIEDNQTLTFANASNVATITGNVTIKSTPTSNSVVYFDVEKFLTCF